MDVADLDSTFDRYIPCSPLDFDTHCRKFNSDFSWQPLIVTLPCSLFGLWQSLAVHFVVSFPGCILNCSNPWLYFFV